MDFFDFVRYLFLKSMLPKSNVPRNKTIKIKNRIFAMEAAPASIPVNPKMPATIAITRKIAAHFSIVVSFAIDK